MAVAALCIRASFQRLIEHSEQSLVKQGLQGAELTWRAEGKLNANHRTNFPLPRGGLGWKEQSFPLVRSRLHTDLIQLLKSLFVWKATILRTAGFTWHLLFPRNVMCLMRMWVWLFIPLREHHELRSCWERGSYPTLPIILGHGQPKARRSDGGIKGHSLHVPWVLRSSCCPLRKEQGLHSSTISKALGETPSQFSHFCLGVDTSMQTHALGTGPVACSSVSCHLRHPEASETPGQGMQVSAVSSTQPSLQHLLQEVWDGTGNLHTSYRFLLAGRHLKSISIDQWFKRGGREQKGMGGPRGVGVKTALFYKAGWDEKWREKT